MSGLAAYEGIVGPGTLDELRELARHLSGRRLVMVNSTRVGGGVAEILQRMVPLLGELGLTVRWEVIAGDEPFYRATKAFHNALHGKAEKITAAMYKRFLDVGRQNAARLTLDGDYVFVHDPQPVTLIEQRRRHPASKWVWRCHIDVSNPQQRLWQFLERYVLQYDAAVYSSPAFAQRMPMRQILIAPSIDPLSEKNRELGTEEIQGVLRRLEIPTDLPLVTQVSRFDYLKDPVGVIEAFSRLRRAVRCRLLLVGGSATDDPEGAEVLAKVQERAHGHSNIQVRLLPPDSHIEINAIQRASAVVVQKSIREGFGLTVSEALWKARPVVASAVGGIPLQVKHGYSGLLVHSPEGAASAIRHLLLNPDYARRLGENGREHVRQNFLLTRHLADYLLTCLALHHNTESVTLN